MPNFEFDPRFHQEGSASSSPADAGAYDADGPRRGSNFDWSPKISTSAFIQMARRAATGLRAGLDMRRVWELEAQRAKGTTKRVMQEISQKINAGGSFAEAVRESQHFPPLVVELMRVGEQTGKLDEVLFQLADHYERLQTLLRNFALGIAWPMFEFVAAIFIIALVIWLPSTLSGQEYDAIGIGLTGTSGVMWYFTIVGVVGTIAAVSIYALIRGWFGSAPIMIARRIPLVGRCLECLALARCSWVLALAHESGMSPRKTARLALAASHHPLFLDKTRVIDAALADSRPFHEAFVEATVFPDDFLDALHTAELSGTITETMTRKTQDYEKESSSLLARIAVIAGVLVFMMVAAFLVLMIFAMFFKYINMLNGFAEDPLGYEP